MKRNRNQLALPLHDEVIRDENNPVRKLKRQPFQNNGKQKQDAAERIAAETGQRFQTLLYPRLEFETTI